MPSINMFISVLPNFQLVLSIESVSCSLLGNKLKISFAIKSESSEYDEMNRWIRRNEELSSARVSNALARFSKLTVLAFVKAIINSEMNLIRAKFNLPSKCSFNTGTKLLSLLLTLVFFI
jgi:hypothetical protein